MSLIDSTKTSPFLKANQRVVVLLLAPFPAVHVRAEPGRQFADRLREAADQQIVPPLRRIGAEAAVGRVQPVDYAFHARLAEERLLVLLEEVILLRLRDITIRLSRRTAGSRAMTFIWPDGPRGSSFDSGAFFRGPPRSDCRLAG